MKSRTLGVVMIVAEAIRDVSPVPSGILHATFASQITAEDWQRVIAILVEAKLITKSFHVLTWVGPR